MAEIFAAAGSKLFIGPVKARQSTPFVAADFTGSPPITWTEVGLTENLGSLGDTTTAIDFNAISEGRTTTVKGTRKASVIPVSCAFDGTDAGQLAMIAAEKTTSNYAFKVVFPDKSITSGSTGTTRYFVGLVMDAPEQLNTVNDVVRINFQIQPNSNLVKVAAS